MSLNPLTIQAGELRHSVTIQAPTNTRDAAGQTAATWSQVFSTRAKIESTTGLAYKESFTGNALASSATDLITIRWPGSAITIEPGMRVQLGNDLFLIQAVDNVLRRNRKLRLACLLIDGNSN